ncbi:YtxH domain-containing protein [Fulvivirga sp.]|uniref:YtxH domain-containing protein n=1 Tax=Fulvivirga sp. TaxID=1931237 RepID=UPI0032EC6DC5
MKNSNSTGKLVSFLLLGTAVGAILGAGLGILLAPETGKKTRKNLLNQGDKLRGVMEKKFNELVKDIKKEVGVVQHDAKELISNSVKKAENLI